MRIYDGREAFSQWDKNVMLTSPVFKIGDEVHITNNRLPNALTVVVYDYNGKAVVDVPNILLQTSYPIVAYRYIYDGKSGYTIDKHEFTVNQKPKPDDYVYTETEILTITTAVEKALLEAKESGEFDGTDGEDGLSAYEIAVKNGFEGTETEWLESLTEATSQGRSASYTFTSPGWKRILNVIRATNGTINMGIATRKPYRMVQCLALDFTGFVKFPEDTKTDSKPIITKRYENVFGEDDAIRGADCRITQVRIGYPKAGTSFPNAASPAHEADYKVNPINCYVEVYVDFDPSEHEWVSFNMNFTGFANSHNCEAITVETDATDTGIYGETLTYYEVDVSSMNTYAQIQDVNSAVADCIKRDAINKDGLYPHYGLTFTGGGKGNDIRIVPATNAQIDSVSSTVYNPITPGNLEYAVKSIGDKHYALVSEFSKYFPLASKYGLYLNNGYLSVTPATTEQIDLRKSQYSVITPYNLKYAVDSVLKEHGWVDEKGQDSVLTDADKTDIVNSVIAALPVYDGSVV